MPPKLNAAKTGAGQKPALKKKTTRKVSLLERRFLISLFITDGDLNQEEKAVKEVISLVGNNFSRMEIIITLKEMSWNVDNTVDKLMEKKKVAVVSVVEKNSVELPKAELNSEFKEILKEKRLDKGLKIDTRLGISNALLEEIQKNFQACNPFQMRKE